MAKDKKIYKKPKENEKNREEERKRKGRGEGRQAGISHCWAQDRTHGRQTCGVHILINASQAKVGMNF